MKSQGLFINDSKSQFGNRNIQTSTLFGSTNIQSNNTNIQVASISPKVEKVKPSIFCYEHRIKHLQYKDVTITAIKKKYDNILIKVFFEKISTYGKLLCLVSTNVQVDQIALEMAEACVQGFNSTDNDLFLCEDKRVILIPYHSDIGCIFKYFHESLDVFLDKMINEDSVCCVNSIKKLTLRPHLEIGSKCTIKGDNFKNIIGVCKWMGQINGLECVGVEMKNWISQKYNGFCCGIKVFDCKQGYGAFFRSSDIEIEEVKLTQHGFVDLHYIYQVERKTYAFNDMLTIGRRVQVLYTEEINDMICNKKIIFGIIKWIGLINSTTCVGIELDYPCEGAMDGVITSSESFTCEPNNGAVCMLRDISFDSNVFDIEFTVEKGFNIDLEISYYEDWNQDIVKERQLKQNKNLYVHIEKQGRYLSIKGVLKWFGFIQGVLIGIIKMLDEIPTSYQQNIEHILKDIEQGSYLVVHSQYLFNYRTLKSYERNEDAFYFNIESKTKFGFVKWRGLDGDDKFYYGCKKEEPSEEATNGTFHGQKLFSCSDGCGILISANKIRESILLKKESLGPLSKADSEENLNEEWTFLLTEMINNNKISLDSIIPTIMKMEKKNILGHLIRNLNADLSKYSEVITELINLKAFDCLQIFVEKCRIEENNDQILLKIASGFIKCGNNNYFENCMKKCTNKNCLMDNGETFLTYIIKEKVNQKTIIHAIEEYDFDMTKPNKDNCNPLGLACDFMMVDVVNCIIKNVKNQEISKMTCSICMDKDIDTVFNCGHNSCADCSKSITQCHICKKTITAQGPLYL